MMHLVPATPPAHVQMLSGFDYVTVDAQRRRVYAAHTGSGALLVVNADSGAVIGQVEVGPMHGSAPDPATGHVYTGDGEARAVSEVDPVALTELRKADVDGNVDAIALDPSLHRIYADEDDGTHVFVVDTQTMKETASIPIPGHKPEYLAVDPETHDLYQNIANLSEVAVISASTLAVTRVIPTPSIVNNHPLVYDPAYHVLVVGGKNGTLASFSRDGEPLGTAAVPQAFDQCDLDRQTHMIACAGSDRVVVVSLAADGTLAVVASAVVADDVHTVAFDPTTGSIWIVWAAADGDFVQRLDLKP
jgi:DNA-binding beta-propeller fold protein YncE